MYQVQRYYRHSGAVPVAGPFWILVIGGIGTALLSVVYGFLVYYSPIVYINFIFPLVFGFLAGLAVGLGGMAGKVRNNKVMIGFGFLFGLAAEYAGWIVYIYAASKRELFLYHPRDLLTAILEFSEWGAWSVFGWTPTGREIFVFWGAEAVIIVGLTTFAAWAVLASTPFCERCRKWLDEPVRIGPLEAVEDLGRFKGLLEQGSYFHLEALGRADEDAEFHTKLELLQCPGCRNLHLITVKAVPRRIGGKDNEAKLEETVVENYLISSGTYSTLKNRWPEAVDIPEVEPGAEADTDETDY